MAPLRKFLVVVLLCASPLAHSDPLSIISGNVDAKSKAARANAAAELLADIDRFASLVQSPRPAEAAWVEAEQAQIAQIKNTEDSVARVAQLQKSPEFQQYKLHGHLQEIRNALRCVVQAPPTLQREMFCWAVASFLLDETDVFAYGTTILLRAKRLPEDLARRVGAATDDGIQLRYRWISRGIQQYVVLPYLRGEVR